MMSHDFDKRCSFLSSHVTRSYPQQMASKRGEPFPWDRETRLAKRTAVSRHTTRSPGILVQSRKGNDTYTQSPHDFTMMDMQESSNMGKDTTTTSSDVNMACRSNNTLASELFLEYQKKTKSRGCDEEDHMTDHESLIQNVLSALGTQPDLVGVWETEQSNGNLVDWISQSLQIPDDETMNVEERYEPGTIVYEWYMGIQLIAIQLSYLSPFEIHHMAMESLMFTEDSQSYRILCMMLCSIALQKCPTPIETMWKRWQSLLCETIRFFQEQQREQKQPPSEMEGMKTPNFIIPLWTGYIVPACQHVLQQLPSEALHTAVISGLVGTTSNILKEDYQRTIHIETEEFQLRSDRLVTTVRTIIQQGGYEFEEWICSYPWRSRRRSFDEKNDENDDDVVMFEKYRDDLTWWSQKANRHDHVAGMDTNWDEMGIAILTFLAFEDRPLTLTPSYIWKTWFPHVTILFKAVQKYPHLENLPTTLLEKLFTVVPERSLPAVSSTSADVDAPYEAFQLLSNRMMANPSPSPKHNNKKKSMKDVELDSKVRSQFIVANLKGLLNRYQVVNQVKIVRKLVHDCPHPGLRARFLDLLRPLIFEEECFEPLWSYLGSFLKDVQCHVDEEREELVQTPDLISKVEIYVGVVTMVQLWCLVKGKLPRKIKGGPLGSLYKVLQTSITFWMSDDNTMPPNDYYRLFLLEGALQQLVHTLDAARQERKHGGNGLSSSVEGLDSISEGVEANITKGATDVQMDQTKDVVVGDIGIFS